MADTDELGNPKVDWMARDSEGRTLLIRLVSVGASSDLVAKASAQGAAPDQNGATPFPAAVRTLNLDLIGAYLRSGAQASISDHDGTTPLALLEMLCVSENSRWFAEARALLRANPFLASESIP